MLYPVPPAEVRLFRDYDEYAVEGGMMRKAHATALACLNSGSTTASDPWVHAEVRSFLDRVYALSMESIPRATDHLFQAVDGLLHKGDFSWCDEMLRQANVSQLAPALLRSFLTITAPAKVHLAHRDTFYKRAFGEMERLKGREKAERLLGRLG